MTTPNHDRLGRPTRRIVYCLSYILCLLPAVAVAGLSSAYYDGVNTSSASLLRGTLNATISAGHVQLGYDNTWTPLRDMDEAHPTTDQVRLIYGGALRDKFAGTASDGSPLTGGWNREHMFPQSFFNQDEPMRSDIHALYPSDTDINTRRSNSPYDVVTSPTYEDALGNRATTTVFEPADIDKGRVARAIFYMDLRYEGLNGEPDLTVGNSYPGGTGAGQMAFLSTLLNWHRQYPPDAAERSRNYKAYRYQQNANPFVDHPEWVDDLYGGPAWLPQHGDSLVLTGNGPAGTTIEAGRSDVPVLVIPATTTGQEVHLGSLTLHQSGSLAGSQITRVSAWYDVNADGLLSPEDSRLGSGTPDNEVTTVTLEPPFYFAPGFNQLLITVNIPIWATADKTFKLDLLEDGVSLASTGGMDSVVPFGLISSNEHTVISSTDPLAGLVISEVFEGSQGNLKYLELYNSTSGSLELGTPDVVLRRYTNGNETPTVLALPTVSLLPGQLYVIANNSTEFSAAFGFAPDAVDNNITHNGNDCYELYRVSSAVVLDAFAGDHIANETNFAVDCAAHRLPELLPNSGNWSFPANIPAGAGLSPSGIWHIRPVTAGNGNAQQAGSPGQLTNPRTSVDEWSNYQKPLD